LPPSHAVEFLFHSFSSACESCLGLLLHSGARFSLLSGLDLSRESATGKVCLFGLSSLQRGSFFIFRCQFLVYSVCLSQRQGSTYRSYFNCAKSCYSRFSFYGGFEFLQLVLAITGFSCVAWESALRCFITVAGCRFRALLPCPVFESLDSMLEFSLFLVVLPWWLLNHAHEVFDKTCAK
jgi:hypothetical protein